MNSVLTNHPGLTNRFWPQKFFLLHKHFGFNEYPGLTNIWPGPERFVKFGDHCTVLRLYSLRSSDPSSARPRSAPTRLNISAKIVTGMNPPRFRLKSCTTGTSPNCRCVPRPNASSRPWPRSPSSMSNRSNPDWWHSPPSWIRSSSWGRSSTTSTRIYRPVDDTARPRSSLSRCSRRGNISTIRWINSQSGIWSKSNREICNICWNPRTKWVRNTFWSAFCVRRRDSFANCAKIRIPFIRFTWKACHSAENASTCFICNVQGRNCEICLVRGAKEGKPENLTGWSINPGWKEKMMIMIMAVNLNNT